MRQDNVLRQWARDHLVEIRLDLCTDTSAAQLAATVAHFGPERCLVTCRAAAQTAQLYQTALQLGVAFVDLEIDAVAATPQAFGAPRGATRRILSSHICGQRADLGNLQALLHRATALGCAVAKLVVAPRTLIDMLPLLHLARTPGPGPALLALATGRQGFFSRVLVAQGVHPPPFTFARLPNDAGTAAGQPLASQLQDIFGLAHLRRDTPVFGVLGTPLDHSLSPWLHNRALQRAGCPGVYLPFDVAASPQTFCTQMAPLLGVRGLSVTRPYKADMLPMCKTLDQAGRQIGAVNTMVRRGDGWHGSNTDAAAVQHCLRTLVRGPLQGRTILVVGGGGVARATAWVAMQQGARLLVTARRLQQAQTLALAFGGTALPLAAVYTQPLDVVVNCTPVGAPPLAQQTPLDVARLPQGCAIVDALYQPSPTQLVAQAQARGLLAIDGMQLLVQQALGQAMQFYDASVVQAMRDVAASLPATEALGISLA